MRRTLRVQHKVARCVGAPLIALAAVQNENGLQTRVQMAGDLCAGRVFQKSDRRVRATQMANFDALPEGAEGGRFPAVPQNVREMRRHRGRVIH